MALIFNNTEVEDVVFNSTSVDEVIFNGVVVWERHHEPVPITLDQFTIETTATSFDWGE